MRTFISMRWLTIFALVAFVAIWMPASSANSVSMEGQNALGGWARGSQHLLLPDLVIVDVGELKAVSGVGTDVYSTRTRLEFDGVRGGKLCLREGAVPGLHAIGTAALLLVDDHENYSIAVIESQAGSIQATVSVAPFTSCATC